MQAVQRAASPVIPVIALVVGVVLALVANYGLDKLADSSDAWHQIQHGTFFVGGVIAGVGGTLLYRFARSRG